MRIKGLARARLTAVAALVMLLGTAVLFGAASPGGAASPNVTFGLSCSPPTLTPGDEWGCSGTIANLGQQTATHLTLIESIPGASLTASSFSRTATCELYNGGGTTCSLGNLAAGGEVTFTTVFTTSASSSGTLSNLAYVTLAEGPNDQDTGKIDSRCAKTNLALNPNTSPPCGSLESTQIVAAGNLDVAGGYLAYTNDDALATAQGPQSLTATSNVSTSAQVPFRSGHPGFGFGATIVERLPSVIGEFCRAGFTCFGQGVDETFDGQFLTTDPIVATFRLIVPKGKNANNTLIFHNGVGPGQSCLVAPLSLTNDFCVSEISQSSKTKVVTIIVLSTNNGRWGFG